MRKELNLFRNFKWIYRQAKASIPVCLLILLLNCAASLLNVGVALASKRMVDHAGSQQFEAAFLSSAIFGMMIIARIIQNQYYCQVNAGYRVLGVISALASSERLIKLDHLEQEAFRGAGPKNFHCPGFA